MAGVSASHAAGRSPTLRMPSIGRCLFGRVDMDDRVIRALRRGWPAGLRGGSGDRLREGQGFGRGNVQGQNRRGLGMTARRWGSGGTEARSTLEYILSKSSDEQSRTSSATCLMFLSGWSSGTRSSRFKKASMADWRLRRPLMGHSPGQLGYRDHCIPPTMRTTLQTTFFSGLLTPALHKQSLIFRCYGI